MLYEVIPTFESYNENLKCEHYNKATEQRSPLVLFGFRYFTETNLCFACFNFRKDVFTRINKQQEEQEDQNRGKGIEVKQTEKDKISFL